LYWYRDNAQGITRNIQPSDVNDMVFALNQIIDNARTQPPSQMPSRIITPLIINFFNEIKGIHAKLYGFYNYSEHTISTLKAAAGLLPSGSLSLKRRLHLRYPGLWKRVSQLRHILRRGR
ncbi:glycosyl transferase, partial [Klebsiella pneumoniae]